MSDVKGKSTSGRGLTPKQEKNFASFILSWGMPVKHIGRVMIAKI